MSKISQELLDLGFFKICTNIRYDKLYKSTGPDSLVVRASASGAVGRGFAPRPRHTKGGKNGNGSSLADARNKRVVPGKYKTAGGYLLTVSKRDVKQGFFIFIFYTVYKRISHILLISPFICPIFFLFNK